MGDIREYGNILNYEIFDPVIGRDSEVLELINVLCNRRKSNAVLVGPPGVGKTAIVEELSSRIKKGLVPTKLLHCYVYALDISAMLAGTTLRGQFEERLLSVIKALVASKGRVILFVDEMHMLLGAGDKQGSMDAGNILKPYLARGQIRCIGATTSDEYKLLEADPAFSRRFQSINVREPTEEETFAILKRLSSLFSEYHGVPYNDKVLRGFIESTRKDKNTFFPDKAIDKMDSYGAEHGIREDLLARCDSLQNGSAKDKFHVMLALRASLGGLK